MKLLLTLLICLVAMWASGWPRVHVEFSLDVGERSMFVRK